MCRCRRRARQPLPVPRACHTSPCLCTTSTSPLNLPAHPPLRLKCPLRSVLTLHSQDSEVALFQNWISKQNNLSIHLINTFIVFSDLIWKWKRKSEKVYVHESTISLYESNLQIVSWKPNNKIGNYNQRWCSIRPNGSSLPTIQSYKREYFKEVVCHLH